MFWVLKMCSLIRSSSTAGDSRLLRHLYKFLPDHMTSISVSQILVPNQYIQGVRFITSLSTAAVVNIPRMRDFYAL
jgi:hypothetical protein